MTAVVSEMSFKDKTVKEEYPNFLLGEVNDTTPLMVKLCEPGDVPLIGQLGNVRKVIARISLSAYNIDRLLRTHEGVVFSQSPEDRVKVRTVQEYLEAIKWT